MSPSYCKYLAFSSSSPAMLITNIKQVALGSRHILFSLPEILKSSLELSVQPACIFLLGSVRCVHTYKQLGACPARKYIPSDWWLRGSVLTKPSRGTGVSITLTGKRPKELFCEICYTGPSQLFLTAL